MDERTEKAQEMALTRELMLNERAIEHPTYGTVVLHRPSPRMEFQIGERRRKQYQDDLKNDEIMSQSELEKVAIKRGIWTKEDSERSQVLQNRIGQIMGLLDTVGYQTVNAVLIKFNDAIDKLVALYKEHPEEDKVTLAIYRYYNLETEVQDMADHSLIFNNAPNSSVEDHMQEIQLYRTQIKLLEEKSIAQKELEPLLVDKARLFKDSIEERSNRVEALAKIYFCALKEDGQPIWKNFEAMWNEKPRDLELLLEEMFFFERGVPDRDRNILARHGFTLRVPTENSSDDLPGNPLPNLDGESQPSEPISSGNSTELIASN
jgi:DNA-binding ferritin-like protein (Dps family)